MLRFIDGFDHYDTNHLVQKWGQVSLGQGSIVPAGGRHNGGCFRLDGLNSADAITKTIDFQPVWTVGLALYYEGSGFGLGNQLNIGGSAVCSFAQWVFNTFTQVALCLDNNGFLYALTQTLTGQTFGNGAWSAPAGFKSSSPLTAQAWHYVEWQTVFSRTVGQMIVRLNGAPVISTAANLNTSVNINGSSPGADTLRIGGRMIGTFPGDTGARIDDLYTVDGQAGQNTGFLGDVTVRSMLPSADGATNQWTPTGASNNYQCVNNNPPDDDTTYVSSATAGQQELYTPNATGLPATGSVLGVQHNVWARKDDAGSRIIEPLVHTGSTTAAGSQSVLNTSYQDYTSVMETNPANGGALFTLSELSTDQFGVQEVA